MPYMRRDRASVSLRPHIHTHTRTHTRIRGFQNLSLPEGRKCRAIPRGVRVSIHQQSSFPICTHFRFIQFFRFDFCCSPLWRISSFFLVAVAKVLPLPRFPRGRHNNSVPSSIAQFNNISPSLNQRARDRVAFILLQWSVFVFFFSFSRSTALLILIKRWCRDRVAWAVSSSTKSHRSVCGKSVFAISRSALNRWGSVAGSSFSRRLIANNYA